MTHAKFHKIILARSWDRVLQNTGKIARHRVVRYFQQLKVCILKHNIFLAQGKLLPNWLARQKWIKARQSTVCWFFGRQWLTERVPELHTSRNQISIGKLFPNNRFTNIKIANRFRITGKTYSKICTDTDDGKLFYTWNYVTAISFLFLLSRDDPRVKNIAGSSRA